MATDLKTVHDHPANLLITLRDSGRPWLQRELVRVGVEGAAAHLRAYEKDHDVTFAALDNDTLERVRSLYTTDPEPGHNRSLYYRPDEFIRAVADLLGLDD